MRRETLWTTAGLVAASITGAGAACETGERDGPPRARELEDAPTEPRPVEDTFEEVNPRLLRRFQPLPAAELPRTAEEEARVALGRRLFHDKSLSADGSVACSSCHDLARYGTDGLATSVGAFGQVGPRNAPTVVNAGWQFRMFWDGRAATLEEQAKGPILNPGEMGMPDGDAVAAALRATGQYRESFARAFPGEKEPITFDNYAKAIAAFERTLVTRSRWDSFLEGDRTALSREEKRGLKTFLNAGCMVCHTGRLLGGATYERAGVVEPWPNQNDLGRYVVTRDEGDRMVFKVPTLRNVAKTAPYFHDGSAKTLDDAVRMMGRHQLGLDLSEDETRAIVTWLECLTGELPPSDLVD